ncbi:MAG: DUF4430 domain-containing protein [candidate division Zixibacteria bacterium]|nr:DUF4430 domain-containing protein [candidate division Zixibacteria bacterium]NIR65679.1 DUF4430 domain-containing protein [candidate division Zixibacteria bacterium]NIS16010.1 DUF4430 domain-containing protein [candidate division Zixibacteria bacterium]NIS47378.1 DUF4430 domain-containing protein [candidate division Zixibacteria bacterium]NIT52419.1 DUF4430 domain-containing protein [candidate division Zixibacteria bacterium]
MMKLKAAVLILFVSFIILYCSGENQEESGIDTIVLIGQDGRTVFDILLEEHKVDYVESEMGVFIQAIDGIENKAGRFWMYSINGEPGKIACDRASVSEGDTIRWEYK